MHIAGSIRPLNDLDDMELRRHRLAELVSLELVSSKMSVQLARAVADLDTRIAAAREARWAMPLALAA